MIHKKKVLDLPNSPFPVQIHKTIQHILHFCISAFTSFNYLLIIFICLKKKKKSLSFIILFMFILFNIVYLKKSTYGFISDLKFFFIEKNVTQAIHNNKTLLKFSSMLIFKLVIIMRLKGFMKKNENVTSKYWTEISKIGLYWSIVILIKIP